MACPFDYPILVFTNAGRVSRCHSKDLAASCNYEGKMAPDPTGLQPDAKWSQVQGAHLGHGLLVGAGGDRGGCSGLGYWHRTDCETAKRVKTV